LFRTHTQKSRIAARFVDTIIMKSLLGLLLLALLGASAAFLKPMRPVQVQAHGGSAAASTYVGLDNPGVVEDPKITPARKCA
jgi:hypothetical protein